MRERIQRVWRLVLTMMMGPAAFAELQVTKSDGALTKINDENSVEQRYAINVRGSVHARAINIRDATRVTAGSDLDAVLATSTRLSAAYADAAQSLDDGVASGLGISQEEQINLRSCQV